MRIGDLVARIVTERRAHVWFGVIAGAVVCLIIFVSRISLDSEVLNMLPGKFSSVQGLKIYDRAFEQTRELTFALHCQPWAERVLAGSPMQTPDGIRDLQSIAVPLLLNLEPPAFEETISVLQPEKLRERFHRFREQIEAGSPRAQFELEFDHQREIQRGRRGAVSRRTHDAPFTAAAWPAAAAEVGQREDS